MPKIPPSPRKRGRPTNFRKEYSTMIIEWAKQGVLRSDMARALGCRLATFENWARISSDFSAALTEVFQIEEQRRSIAKSAIARPIPAIRNQRKTAPVSAATSIECDDLKARLLALEMAVERIEVTVAARSGRQAVIDVLATLNDELEVAENESDIEIFNPSVESAYT